MTTLKFTNTELEIIFTALRCYDLEIDHEDDDNHPIFKALQERVRKEFYKDI